MRWRMCKYQGPKCFLWRSGWYGRQWTQKKAEVWKELRWELKTSHAKRGWHRDQFCGRQLFHERSVRDGMEWFRGIAFIVDVINMRATLDFKRSMQPRSWACAVHTGPMVLWGSNASWPDRRRSLHGDSSNGEWLEIQVRLCTSSVNLKNETKIIETKGNETNVCEWAFWVMSAPGYPWGWRMDERLGEEKPLCLARNFPC